MYLRREADTLSGGRVVHYLSLAHNVREKGPNGRSRTKPIRLLNLGTEEELDPLVVELVHGIIARAEPTEAGRAHAVVTVQAMLKAMSGGRKPPPPAELQDARELGLQLLVEGVWDDLGLRSALKAFQAQHRCEFDLEAVVFAMVLNRLVDPKSKLACNEWVQDHAAIPGAEAWQPQHFYRAMDLLHEHWAELEATLATHFAKARPEECTGLQLVDTTSWHFEADHDDHEVAELAATWALAHEGQADEPWRDEPQVVNEPALRLRGHSKAHRPECPQVVVASQCSPSGFVVRHKVYPGNTNDHSIAKDLAESLPPATPEAPKVWVCDAGMLNASVRGTLRQAGWHHMAAASLKGTTLGRSLVEEGMSAFKAVKGKPHLAFRSAYIPAKEHPEGLAETWVLICNQKERERALARIQKHVEAAKEALGIPAKEGTGHAKATCKTVAHPSKGKYVCPSPKQDGSYVLDEAAIQEAQAFPGLRGLRTNLAWKGADLVKAYTNQRAIEEKHREYKSLLKLRPCHHRKADRIRAHCMLVVLAANVAQFIQGATGLDLEALRKEAKSLRVGLFVGEQTRYWARTQGSPNYLKAYRALSLPTLPNQWEAWIGRGPAL